MKKKWMWVTVYVADNGYIVDIFKTRESHRRHRNEMIKNVQDFFGYSYEKAAKYVDSNYILEKAAVI